MTEKRFTVEDIVKGISIQLNSNFPVELLNEETQEWEIIHSVQFNDTIYCSEEVYNKLKKELEND